MQPASAAQSPEHDLCAGGRQSRRLDAWVGAASAILIPLVAAIRTHVTISGIHRWRNNVGAFSSLARSSSRRVAPLSATAPTVNAPHARKFTAAAPSLAKVVLIAGRKVGCR